MFLGLSSPVSAWMIGSYEVSIDPKWLRYRDGEVNP
ncbi:hypothetical protein HP15_4168 [Marinobacter adhaerens HP15]|uniref:Uncharacterized protein n=1 Tax=Marinobacter adhaerens (strain DSM 23420 / HP15) TaxID=225937 RepID=E4PMM4_MARAH|nr:hypothetical protein HP15_4168 [Marinobacter adhaerens HP15]